jgi:hypothetical protein
LQNQFFANLQDMELELARAGTKLDPAVRRAWLSREFGAENGSVNKLTHNQLYYVNQALANGVKGQLPTKLDAVSEALKDMNASDASKLFGK